MTVGVQPPRRIVPGPLTRLVSQVRVDLDCRDRPDLFDRVLDTCLRWLGERAGPALPSAAWAGASFELEDIGSQRAAAVRLREPASYWTARLDDADKGVPQRVWVTEIALSQETPERLFLGVRLVCVTRGVDAPYVRSVPAFVRRIVDSYGASLDGRKIGRSPWIVATNDGVEELVGLLRDQSRQSDVIVCSLPEGAEDPSDAAVSASLIHTRTLGAAHVAVLTGPASFYLTDRIGREFSVFRSAVRTYRPGFDVELDDPFRHPLCLPARIAGWTDGAKGFETFLVSEALTRSVAVAEPRLRPFSAVRQQAARLELESQRTADASDQELLDLALEENAALERSLEELRTEYEGLRLQAEQGREDARQQADQSAAREFRLRERIESLEAKLSAAVGAPVPVSIPVDLTNFQPWCEQNLTGQVEVLHRAFRGAKSSVFNDPTLLYRALLLLRDHYAPMRKQGGPDRKKAFDAAATEIGLKEEPTFSGDRWGEQGETYRVVFNGRPHLLDRHLKAGDSRDPRFCFRLYFFWDEESEQVVVGWLPSHLETRAS